MNALTNSEVEAEDKLFMTLDPTSRRLRFPREGEVIITDTVGFLADLPEDLVAAFRATLEELADADLLLHVVDASDPRVDDKLESVEALLEELELADLTRLVVLNKVDLLSGSQAEALAARLDGVAVSALKRRGFDELIAAAEDRLPRDRPLVEDPEEVTYKGEEWIPDDFDPADYGVVEPEKLDDRLLEMAADDDSEPGSKTGAGDSGG